MAIFKTIGFQQIFNFSNTPAAGNDRFGLPIKQLMIQLNSNQLFILDENNNIYPLSSKYASIKNIEQLRKQISMISGQIQGGLAWRGNQPDVFTVQQLKAKHPTPKNGEIYTIGDGRQYIYIGSEKWQQLGVNYNYMTKHFIPSGCTFAGLSSYIAISEWNKLISACTPGVYDALNTIIEQQHEPLVKNFNQFFQYCMGAGVNAMQALNYAIRNYKLIMELPSSIISSIVSGGVLNDYLSSYIAASSVFKPEFMQLSGSYNTLINNLISDKQHLEENLSALQIQLERVNGNLSTVYSTL